MAATAANMCGVEGFLLPESGLGCCDSPDSCLMANNKPRVRFEITSVTDTPSGDESEDEYDFDPDDLEGGEDSDDEEEEDDEGEEEDDRNVTTPSVGIENCPEAVTSGNIGGSCESPVGSPAKREVGNKLSELDVWRSRFRIVRISSSGPHKVGAWTVTDYYDNEVPALARATAPLPLSKSCSVPAFPAIPSCLASPAANLLSAGVTPSSASPFIPVAVGATPGVKPPLSPKVSDPSGVEKRQNNRLPEGVALECLARQVLGDSRRSSNDSNSHPHQHHHHNRHHHQEPLADSWDSQSPSSSEENSSSVPSVASKENNCAEERKVRKKCLKRCHCRHREVVVCRRKKYLTAADVGRRLVAARLAAAGRPKQEDPAPVNGTALKLKASLEKELRAELETRLEHRLSELDRDVRFRALTKRNVQLSSQVQLLKEHVHALKRAVACLRKEKSLLERRMSESERLRSESEEVMPGSYADG